MIFAQRVIDLDTVWGDMRVFGDPGGGLSGTALASGDINGDGHDDIIIGSPEDYVPRGYKAGEVYVIFGSSDPPYTFDLTSQSADITVYGCEQFDNCGYAVASGDVNGDEYDDVIIGAYLADPNGKNIAGETYVIFGSSFPSPPYTIDLYSQAADITVYGEDAGDESGCAVASGDVNRDGYAEIIIGACNGNPPTTEYAGKTHVVFGRSFSTPPYTIDLDSQPADLTVYGEHAYDFSGRVIGSGDINGDEYDDIFIGVPGADPFWRDDAGETYVIFGSSSLPSIIDLSTSSADIIVYGDDDKGYSGCAIASGDINHDGCDDIIIGAPHANPGGRSGAGETYVIFGSDSPPSTIDLRTQYASITVYGDDAWDYSGHAISSGDVNGDGYDDIIIGVPAAEQYGKRLIGETYVLFGSSFPSPPYTIDLDKISADITVCGDDYEDESGSTVASGDINNDGYVDILIGAPYGDSFCCIEVGETYLIAGGGAFITAHGLGGKSWINCFSLLGRSWGGFKAFGAVNSQGEVHLAVGDTDADGHDEIAAGQGEGGKSWVKFFEMEGSPISSFKAFGASNTNGELHLTMGNFDAVNSDNEIAVAQGEGGQSWVKIFETDGTFITSFKAFGAANAQGEVHLAAGDLNKDGIDEIIAGMGEGGSSVVKIFSYDGTIIRSFRAFDAIVNPGGEVHLAVGNFDADPAVEIAVATGYNGGNKVRLFEKDGSLIKQFLAFGFGGNTNGDVQIAAADIDNDGVAELICGHGEGGSSVVKVFKADGTVIRSFKAFGGVNAQGEVHLGKSNY